MGYYVAYGSNISREQMKARCPGATVAGTGVLYGYRLVYQLSATGYYMNLHPAKGHITPVVVWEVSEEDEKTLDRYEGCPRYYRKTNLKIKLIRKVNGRRPTVKAFIYVLPVRKPFGLPKERYVRICADGYREFGFNIETLENAYWFTKQKMFEQTEYDDDRTWRVING